MTRARICVPRGTIAITRRTVERKLLWTPSDARVEQCLLYALAAAQERERLEVHHGCLMPNHGHWIWTPGHETNLGEALRFFHRESARARQEDLLARGYDAPQQIWDRRSTHVMHLLDSGAVLEQILYQHLNPPKAGLVERTCDYPGFVSPLSLLKGGTIVVPKPDVYFGEDQPAERELVLTPPPELVRLFGSDLEGLVYWLEKSVDVQERAMAKARTRPVVGAERLKRIHPFAEPATCRERRGRRTPRWKVGRGWLPADRRELLKHLRAEDQRFLDEHAEQWARWTAGDRSVAFPFGTLQMVAQHGAAMAAEHLDAVLASADRTSLWVSAPCSPRDAVALAAGAAIEALDEEGDDAERSDPEPRSDASRAAGDGATRAEGPEGQREDVETRGLASPVTTADDEHARRLVTLRDRRRGGGRAPDS
ncbi:MAG: hypothetical protein KC619_14165 [Myxococcales bacterium]|nr:hypothetical protein [Myxococcales bacterium]